MAQRVVKRRVVDNDEGVVVIRPARGFELDVRELWRERELLFFLAGRTIKVRYKQSLAGPGWAVLQPVLGMLIFSLFFGQLAGLPTQHLPYPVFYYSGLVLWLLFATTVTSGSDSIVSNQTLIGKVFFPRIFLPLSAGLAALVDLFVATLVCIPIFLISGYSPSPLMLLAPVFMLPALAAGSGLALIFGALNAKYRDVRFVVPFLVQAGLFASPLAYSTSLVPPGWRDVYALNPMVGSIEAFRWCLTGAAQPSWSMVGISAVVALLVLVFGVWYFQRTESNIADIV